VVHFSIGVVVHFSISIYMKGIYHIIKIG